MKRLHFLLLIAIILFTVCVTGSWNTNTGGNQMHESKLHRIQIPANKGSSLAQSKQTHHQFFLNIDLHIFLRLKNLLLVLKIFHKRTPPEAVDLVSRLLQYSPNLRSTAVSQ